MRRLIVGGAVFKQRITMTQGRPLLVLPMGGDEEMCVNSLFFPQDKKPKYYQNLLELNSFAILLSGGK